MSSRLLAFNRSGAKKGFATQCICARLPFFYNFGRETGLCNYDQEKQQEYLDVFQSLGRETGLCNPAGNRGAHSRPRLPFNRSDAKKVFATLPIGIFRRYWLALSIAMPRTRAFLL